MTYGLQDSGFERPTYDEWLLEYRNLLKQTYGLSDNIGESTLVNDFLSIFALQDMKVWETLEGVYNSQTLTGAEGIYLDEVLGRRGVFRKGASAGTGIAILQTDKTAPWTTVIPTTALCSGDNDISYSVDTDTQIKDKIYAFKLPLVDFGAATTVTFNAKNSSNTSDVDITLNPQDANFLTDLQSWLQTDVFIGDSDLVVVDSDILYVGFPASDLSTPIGVDNATELYATLNVGDKWSGVPVTATETGFNPLPVAGLNSITPASFTSGANTVIIQDTTNFTAFFSGALTETDAEYRARFNNVVDEAAASTRPAVISSILDIDGVFRVKIYDNPTSNSTPEAPAFSFHTIVLGGATAEIAQTIYEKKPINTIAYGSVDTVINTEDGGTETVGFSPAEQEQLNIKVIYSTANTLPLSTTEVTDIRSNIIDLSSNFEIGEKIFNSQVKASVYSATDYSRFTKLQIAIKKVSQTESEYSTLDYEPLFNEIPLISTGNILFEQEV